MTSPIHETLEALHQRRLQLGVSRARLAESLHIDRVTLWRRETGQVSDLSIAEIERWRRVLGGFESARRREARRKAKR